MKSILLTLCLILAFPLFGNERVVLDEGNFIVLNQPFTAESVGKVMNDTLTILKDEKLTSNFSIPRINPPKTIYLILDTPGGEVVSGLKMFDFLLSQDVEVKTITLFAASMGFHAVQNLGERLITPSGTLMSHKAKGGFQGEFQSGESQIDSRYNYWMRRIKRMDETVVKKTNGKHTMKSYHKLMENEYWCEGQDCVKQGFADKVVNITCSNKLQESEVKETSMNFFGMSIKTKAKVSKCPLIGAISVVTNIEGITEGFENLYNNQKIDKQIVKFVEKELRIK